MVAVTQWSLSFLLQQKKRMQQVSQVECSYPKLKDPIAISSHTENKELVVTVLDVESSVVWLGVWHFVTIPC